MCIDWEKIWRIKTFKESLFYFYNLLCHRYFSRSIDLLQNLSYSSSRWSIYLFMFKFDHIFFSFFCSAIFDHILPRHTQIYYIFIHLTRAFSSWINVHDNIWLWINLNLDQLCNVGNWTYSNRNTPLVFKSIRLEITEHGAPPAMDLS